MIDKYILGLIASDGFTGCYTCKNGKKTYSSYLEMSEKQIIQDICDIYNKPIHYRKRIIANKEREFWSVRFNNQEIGEYGKYLIKGRPNIKDLFDSFNDNDKINFVRGMFDGDGSIVIGTSNNPYRKTIGFSVNSSQPDMKNIIVDFAKKYNLILSTYLDKRGKGSWYLSFNGRHSLESIYHLFFDNECTIKNIRKYNIFKNFYTIYCLDYKKTNNN